MRDFPLVIAEVTGRTEATGEFGLALRQHIRAIVDRPTDLIEPPRRVPGDIHPALAKTTADTLTNWRLGNAYLRHDWKRERHVFNECLGDLARMRLTKLFLPIIHAIGQVERDIGTIGDISRELLSRPTEARRAR